MYPLSTDLPSIETALEWFDIDDVELPPPDGLAAPPHRRTEWELGEIDRNAMIAREKAPLLAQYIQRGWAFEK